MIGLDNLEGFSDPSHFPSSCLYALTRMAWRHAKDNPFSPQLYYAIYDQPRTCIGSLFPGPETRSSDDQVSFDRAQSRVCVERRGRKAFAGALRRLLHKVDTTRHDVLSTTFVIWRQRGFWRALLMFKLTVVVGFCMLAVLKLLFV